VLSGASYPGLAERRRTHRQTRRQANLTCPWIQNPKTGSRPAFCCWTRYWLYMRVEYASRVCLSPQLRGLKPLNRNTKSYATETRAQATTTDATNRPRASKRKEYGNEKTDSDSIDGFGCVRNLLIVKSAGRAFMAIYWLYDK